MLRFSYLLTIRALSSAVPVALAAMMTAGSVASAQTCTALACQQVSCPVNHSTTLTGKVFAPNGIDPLPNVLVYIPGAPVTGGLDPLPDGVPNGPIRATNSPLVSTTTAVNGTFTLTNVPVGSSIPVVIQAGKWRRLFSIPSVAACMNTSAGNLAFPSNHTQGDIPRIAVVTGSVDAVECAVSKIGIANSEFTNSIGSGRVHLFLGDGAPGSRIDANTDLEHTLVSDQSKLSQYDVVMFPCQGQQFDKFAGDQQNVINYANAGGRMYATHFSYAWLYNDLPFSSTANWAVNSSPAPQDQTAFVNLTTRNGLQLAQWLVSVGASSVLGQIPLNTLKRDVASVVPPSETWLSINDVNFGNTPMQFTFNTPVGANPSLQYGKVLFNDYHVENQNTAGTTFPNECSAAAMTAQEKLLEYTIFNLSTFVAPEFPTLAVGVSHTPNSFKVGDTADQILINLTNTSATQPAGTSLTLTVNLPPGVTPVSIAGANTSNGWSCSGVSCTRTQPFNPSTSDPVLLTVSVSSTVASGSIAVSATAASGGLQNNVTGTDQITTVLLPTITWATPASIVYGTALGSAQLNATANVAGAFNYTPPAGTVLSAGSQQLSVTFTPADSAHYTPATASVLLQVNQATPVNNFSIKPVPPAETVYRGNLAAFLLQLDSINGFKGNVALSCSGGPAGAVCADLPQTVKLNGRAYAISGILFPRSTQPGVYTITYKGVSGSLTNSTTATFTVK